MIGNYKECLNIWKAIGANSQKGSKQLEEVCDEIIRILKDINDKFLKKKKEESDK